MGVSKLVCIYTCEKDKKSLETFKETKLYQKLISNSSFTVLEVYAGANKTVFENGVLRLKCPEEYSKLSLKTYEMIKECVKKFKFDCLIKIDCNVFEHGKHGFGFTEEIRNEFFCEETISKMILDDRYVGSDYGGSAMSYVRTHDSLVKWSTYKNIKISKTEPKYHVPFFVGKFYYMGFDLCKFISDTGRNTSSHFANNLGGAEDVFAGYMFNKFKKLNFKLDIVLDYIVGIVNLVKYENTKQYLRRVIDMCNEDFKKFEFEQRHCVDDGWFDEGNFTTTTTEYTEKLRYLQDTL